MSDLSKLSDEELVSSEHSDSGCAAELISRYMKVVFALAKKYSG